jgi:Tfp pilus assembly protein PilN
MALREINLIPADILNRKVLNKHLVFWIGCLTISLSLIFGCYLYEKHVVLAQMSTFGSLKDTHTHLGLKIQEIKRIQEELEKLDQQQAVLKTITIGPVCWRIILKLAEILNENTWLKTLATDNGRDKEANASLKLSGFSFSNEELGNFLITLSSEPMFKNVLLKYARETIVGRADKNGDDRMKVIEFEIECEL